MKKKIALLLALTTVAASIVGCGSSSSASADETQIATKASADEKADSDQASNDVWELEGYTYEIPPFWKDLEVSEPGTMVDSELVDKILTANEEAEYGVEDSQLLAVIFDTTAGDISESDFKGNYEKLMEKLGNPFYAGVFVQYMDDDIKKSYNDKFYGYNTYYFYQLDETNYLEVRMQQVMSMESMFEYPKITALSIATKDELVSNAENLVEETDLDSAIPHLFADEKGSY